MDVIFEQALIFMNNIISASAEGYAYSKSWGNNYRCTEINTTFLKIKNETNEQFWKKVFALSEEKKLILGFRKATNEDTKLNIPLWIWNVLPDNMIIDGETKPVCKLDNDSRFGVVIYKV